METKEYRFKTNINCGGCIASVSPFLNAETRIAEWKVDTTDKDKVLTVKSEGLSAEEVANVVRSAGYKAVPIG